MEEYTSFLDSSREEYTNRLKDFEKHNLSWQLVYLTHLVNVNQVPDHLQMELIELPEDNILKSLFDCRKEPMEIWNNAVEYPRLRQHAQKTLPCLGITYCCKSAFSYTTQIKNRLKSQMTNIHLEDRFILKSTMLEPNLESSAHDKQLRCSH